MFVLDCMCYCHLSEHSQYIGMALWCLCWTVCVIVIFQSIHNTSVWHCDVCAGLYVLLSSFRAFTIHRYGTVMFVLDCMCYCHLSEHSQYIGMALWCLCWTVCVIVIFQSIHNTSVWHCDVCAGLYVLLSSFRAFTIHRYGTVHVCSDVVQVPTQGTFIVELRWGRCIMGNNYRHPNGMMTWFNDIYI